MDDDGKKLSKLAKIGMGILLMLVVILVPLFVHPAKKRVRKLEQNKESVSKLGVTCLVR